MTRILLSDHSALSTNFSVAHMDVREVNVLVHKETGRVIVIDFE